MAHRSVFGPTPIRNSSSSRQRRPNHRNSGSSSSSSSSSSNHPPKKKPVAKPQEERERGRCVVCGSHATSGDDKKPTGGPPKFKRIGNTSTPFRDMTRGGMLVSNEEYRVCNRCYQNGNHVFEKRASGFVALTKKGKVARGIDQIPECQKKKVAKGLREQSAAKKMRYSVVPSDEQTSQQQQQLYSIGWEAQYELDQLLHQHPGSFMGLDLPIDYENNESQENDGFCYPTRQFLKLHNDILEKEELSNFRQQTVSRPEVDELSRLVSSAMTTMLGSISQECYETLQRASVLKSRGMDIGHSDIFFHAMGGLFSKIFETQINMS